MTRDRDVPLGELDPKVCWRAVIACDEQWDGVFVYAVRSTGVYCRPSCPSRRPRREMVTFFKRPEEAEREGYRACLRCRPQLTDGQEPLVDLVREVCRIIAAGDAQQPPTLSALGARMHLDPRHMQKQFKRIMGITPRQYAEECRCRRLKTALGDGRAVTEALYEAGYGSASRLYEHAAPRLGMTPGVYRRGGTGARIFFTLAPSPLGRLLVACTAKGVCAVNLGDTDSALVESLRKEYPAAGIERDDEGLRGAVEAVLDCLSGWRPHPGLPLDLRLSAFQRRVYEELLRIPYGETRSYKDIAAATGRPGAARAVGRACAANPAALVIPCHRVVREDGGPGGYRWGPERKQRLLALEKEGKEPGD